VAETFDIAIVGAGLAGLVAATEAADLGRRVLVLEQEGRQSLGGQAFWSLGGLFLVDTPEQRRLGIRDSHELASSDWVATAGFDRPEDHWPRRWAEAYVAFAAGEKRSWLTAMGLKLFPVVGWAERGNGDGTQGNSVPRFHITWGTGPGVLEPFLRRGAVHEATGRIVLRFRHRVDALVRMEGAITGVSGTMLAETSVGRGQSSSREVVGDFAITAGAVIVAAGGIGGDQGLVRQNWPSRLGSPPAQMLTGVPTHVDGRMLAIGESAGARLINRDRMWHYVEGITNYAPIWPGHGIRILPGPSSLWLDGTGARLPDRLYPGADTLGQLTHLRRTGHDHSWFVLDQQIIRKEFALSGSEQNPDLTGRDWRLVLRRAIGNKAPGPVEAFKAKGADFIVTDDLAALAAGMERLTPDAPVGEAALRQALAARDDSLASGTDAQSVAIARARGYLTERLIRVAKPHALLGQRNGPLIAVKLHILTRKTLGGLETDLGARVLGADGVPIAGLYAAGEAAGFGGGGMHGYRALEGTFLGGCLFSGRIAGRAAAGAV
jgi:predicted oxidoreductase